MKHKLFAYGTLQDEYVQEMWWGEVQVGKPAVLPGYRRVGAIRIAPDWKSQVTGRVYTLTDEQLAATDDYEGRAYNRVRALIPAHGAVFVYVPKDEINKRRTQV